MPRVVDARLQTLLSIAGAVVIEGARGCGKTMTGLNAAASAVFLDDPDVQAMVEVAPSSVLGGQVPRLLDEWQLAPQLWNRVRRAVDAASGPGQFILTGSAVPADDRTRHTGAGRFLRLRQRSMTWFERGLGQGQVGLGALFSGWLPGSAPAQQDFEQVVDSLLRTGFPAWRELEASGTRTALRGYAQEVVRADLERVGEVRHGPAVMDALLRSVARGAASELRVSTVQADLGAAAPDIAVATVSRYLDLLERLFVIERVPAWVASLRSRARLRTTPKIHPVEPAFAAAVLGAGAEALTRDLRTTGFLFESAVVHDLLVYTEAVGGSVHHFRDSNGHEIDAVLVLEDGRWAAVEVKLGAGKVPAGAASLDKAVAQVDHGLAGEPEFRLVVTGTGPTAVLDSGVVTCPLAALGP